MNGARVILRIVLSAVAVSVLAGTLVVALPTPAAGENGLTAIYIDSVPGDYVGRGEQRYLSSSEYQFSAQMTVNGTLVVGAQNSPLTAMWTFQFRAPTGQALAVGDYEGASELLNTQLPYFSFHTLGRASNDAVSRFTVTVTNPGTVEQDLGLNVHGLHSDDFTIVPNDCGVVAPGASCTFDVTFDPVGMDLREGHIVITDQTRHGRRVVRLSGEPHSYRIVGLDATPNPAAPGQAVTFNTHVSEGGGSVALVDDAGTAIGSASVDTDGNASVTSTLPAGTYWVVAVATGYGYARSESAPVRVVVGP
jgi:hypothetical protein